MVRRWSRRDATPKLRGKLHAELSYWQARRSDGPLEGGVPYYEWTFTEHFGLGREFYRRKRMLDVGCGPRGSLEWADGAAERVGVDPLAQRYAELHSRRHATTYVACGAESIPLPSRHFDVISCFNALDHVDDVDAAIGEVSRVAAPGATLLLLVDVNHDATATEPHRLGWDVLDRFEAAWRVAERRNLERPFGNMLDNLRAARPYQHGADPSREGVLSARLVRDV